jgi:hypothetical protein
VTSDTPLKRDANREQDAIAEDQDNRRCAGVTSLERQIPSHEHEYGRRKDDEIPRGKHKMARRGAARLTG